MNCAHCDETILDSALRCLACKLGICAVCAANDVANRGRCPRCPPAVRARPSATCRHCRQPIEGHTHSKDATFFWSHARSGDRYCNPRSPERAEPEGWNK